MWTNIHARRGRLWALLTSLISVFLSFWSRNDWRWVSWTIFTQCSISSKWLSCSTTSNFNQHHDTTIRNPGGPTSWEYHLPVLKKLSCHGTHVKIVMYYGLPIFVPTLFVLLDIHSCSSCCRIWVFPGLGTSNSRAHLKFSWSKYWLNVTFYLIVIWWWSPPQSRDWHSDHQINNLSAY
jgi:hypothetical protein